MSHRYVEDSHDPDVVQRPRMPPGPLAHNRPDRVKKSTGCDSPREREIDARQRCPKPIKAQGFFVDIAASLIRPSAGWDHPWTHRRCLPPKYIRSVCVAVEAPAELDPGKEVIPAHGPLDRSGLGSGPDDRARLGAYGHEAGHRPYQSTTRRGADRMRHAQPRSDFYLRLEAGRSCCARAIRVLRPS
jgi:hypothetical protein